MNRRDAGDDTNYGALGTGPAFQYWNDLMSVCYATLQEQSMRWTGLWQRAALGGYDPEGVGNLPGVWRSWLESVVELGTFPLQWTMSRFASVPSVVFAPGPCVEFAGPLSVPSPIAARGLMPVATDLREINGTGCISADHVQVEIVDGGRRVEVSLCNLGSRAAAPPSAPRVYFGLACAWDGATRRPLALVYVFMDEQDGGPPVPSRLP
jgi:hypothetical protein